MRAAPTKIRRPRENRTQYVVLGMLSAAPMTGYGLRQAIGSSVGHFWQESFGQLYPALRRLAAEGLVEARATRGGPGRGGATYHITARGRSALGAWLAVPPVLEPSRNEVLLKVFFAGAVPAEVTSRNLDRVAAALRAQQAQLEEIAGWMDTAKDHHPDEPYWRLTLDFGLEFLRMALAWIDRAKAVLARPSPRKHEGAARPARAKAAAQPRRAR
ncbi:MAG TPA: PadR family transcriptional regulator [Anaeromyxobacter sp.]